MNANAKMRYNMCFLFYIGYDLIFVKDLSKQTNVVDLLVFVTS